MKALLRAVRRKGLRNEWRDSDTGVERSPLLPETAAAASQHGSERPASVNSHRSVTQPTISKTRIHFLDNMKVSALPTECSQTCGHGTTLPTTVAVPTGRIPTRPADNLLTCVFRFSFF